jgi:hypothetical protein
MTRGAMVLRLEGFRSFDMKPDRCVALHQINSYLEAVGGSGTLSPSIYMLLSVRNNQTCIHGYAIYMIHKKDRYEKHISRSV